jgi:hypothetical protein
VIRAENGSEHRGAQAEQRLGGSDPPVVCHAGELAFLHESPDPGADEVAFGGETEAFGARELVTVKRQRSV